MKSFPLFTVVLVLVVATGAGAQGAPQQPQPPQTPQQPQEQEPEKRKLATDPASALATGDWNVTVSGFGGYELSKYGYGSPPVGDAASDVPLNLSSPSGGGSARLSMVKTTRHDSTLSFGGGATSSYYRTVGHAYTDANVYASQATAIGRHTTVAAAESVSYAPYYSIGLFPGLGTYAGTELSVPTVPTFDNATKLSPVFRYGAAGQLSHPFTDRTSFTANYSIQLFNAESLVDSVTHDVGGRLSHTISKSFGVHAGYSFTTATYRGIPGNTGFHNIDVGVDLHKALSLSRRTVFSFSTGSTIVRRDVGSASSGAHTEFRLLGGADLDQYIGRTWSARVSYVRDWQLLEGSLIPFFSDAVSAGIGGNAGRSVTIGLSTSYLIGSMLGAAGGAHDQALSGTAWLQYEIGRALATYVQYGYYLHRFESSGAGLNLPARFDRNAVRVGLTLVLPPGR